MKTSTGQRQNRTTRSKGSIQSYYLLKMKSPTLRIISTSSTVTISAERGELLLQLQPLRFSVAEMTANLENETEHGVEVAPKPSLPIRTILVQPLDLCIDN